MECLNRGGRRSCLLLSRTTCLPVHYGHIHLRAPLYPVLGSGSRHDCAGSGLVEDESLDRVELARPGGKLEHPAGVRVAGLATPADAVGTEVDVLGVVLAFQR